jgi:small-conductance mechanosensitive channel
MSDSLQRPVVSDGNRLVEATPPAIPEEGATSSLADLVVGFDISPYLGGPFKEIWGFLQNYPLLFASVLVALGYGIGWVLKSLIHRLLDQIRKHEKSELDYEIVHYLTSPVLQTVVTLSMVLALATLDFPGAVEHLLVKVCFTALLLFWGRAWFRATSVILRALEADRHRFRLIQPRTVPLYEMGIKLLLLGLFVYFFFLIWGINATAWVASAGILGIVVGFAARDTLANLISGVSIVADAPYKIGDYIVLDTGERGLVVSLGIRSTRLLTRDDVEISIPNAVIGAAKIINESGGPWIRHRIRLPVGVAYDSDIDKVIATLEDIAGQNAAVADEPAPRVRIRGFGDNSINLELLGWIRRPEDRGQVVHQLALETIKRFRKENIEIPFPQRDLHLRDKTSATATPDLQKSPVNTRAD